MKTIDKIRASSLCIVFMLACAIGCKSEYGGSSDQRQSDEQERILAEGTSQVGMPSIKNFRERKILKDILELRDQDGLVTFTYMENLQPAPVAGKTALGGKLTYLGQTIGYGLPYATQFTNPEKPITYGMKEGFNTIPQADPNGLFSPDSAEGTWVLMKDHGGSKTVPVYIEPRIVVTPFKLPMD